MCCFGGLFYERATTVKKLMGLALAAFVAGTFLMTVGCSQSTPSKPAASKPAETKKDGGDKMGDGDKKPGDGDKKPEDKKP
jgi:hypothetical protein